MTDSTSRSVERSIDLAETPEFDLGMLRVHPALRTVRHGDDCRELEPLVMKVLVALAMSSPTVMSRDRLIEECWDGRVVSDDALNRCIVALRHIVREFADAGVAIETVPRVGYRLRHFGPGSAALGGDASGADREPASERGRGSRWQVPALVLAALVFIVAAALFIAQGGAGKADEGRLSIAVLPFRNLAPGDPFFAEGMSEEILTRLSREPGFKVAGQMSSSVFRNGADLREVGSKLGVDYILEGSVRSQSRSVRVETALVQASDGKRIWTKSFEGSLDDAFAIQDEIGQSVVNALTLKFAPSSLAAKRRPANGEAYNRYVTARGLIRTRNRDYSPAAIGLLKESLRIDPHYAPAWARLSEATWMAASGKGRDAVITAQRAAEAQARRALALDPNLAEGHVALGVLLGFGSPEAQSHLRRAAQLDPNNAETQLWMGIAHKAAGEFDQEVSAYRRAYEIDPFWFRTGRDLSVALADRGRRHEAEAIAGQEEGFLARIAWSYGDLSEAVRHWRMVLRPHSPQEKTAARGIETARYLSGLSNRPPPPTIFPQAADIGRGVSIAWLPSAPSPAEWRERTRDAVTQRILHNENLYAAKLMLNEGRSAELLGTYDQPPGLLGIRRGQRLRAEQLWDVPSVALVLQSGGREEEARRLLAEADALIGHIARGSGVPISFDASAAGVWAVQGRTGKALDALERAWRRGWRTIFLTGPLDLADDPAFRALRGNPRFERLRVQFARHFRREREEIVRLPR